MVYSFNSHVPHPNPLSLQVRKAKWKEKSRNKDFTLVCVCVSVFFFSVCHRKQFGFYPTSPLAIRLKYR